MIIDPRGKLPTNKKYLKPKFSAPAQSSVQNRAKIFELQNKTKIKVISHHPTSVKDVYVKNFYKAAKRTSSGPTELAHSFKIVDDLLQKNGCKDPRTIAMAKSKTSKSNNKRKNK